MGDLLSAKVADNITIFQLDGNASFSQKKKQQREVLIFELKTGLCLTVDERFKDHEGWAPYLDELWPGWSKGQRWLLSKAKDSWRISSALLPSMYLTSKSPYDDKRAMVVLRSKENSQTQCWKPTIEKGSFYIQSCEGGRGVWDVGTAATREERFKFGRAHDQWLWTWPVNHGALRQQFMLLEPTDLKF